MTKSDHEKERRAFWETIVREKVSFNSSPNDAACYADYALAERDKRFPAPEESEVSQ